MAITINRQLNLVIPILRDDKTSLYIHSMPIGPEVFDTYYLVLAKTFSAFASEDIGPISGPRVAAKMMRDIAKSTQRAPGVDWWDGDDGVNGSGGLFAEMIRLSNAIVPRPEGGWGPMQLQDALNQGLLDAEEKDEVLNILAFFTVVSAAPPKQERARLVKGMAILYQLQATSSSFTDFITSLKTSTPAENIGGNAPAS